MNKPLLTLFALIGLFMGIILTISPCEAGSFGSSPPWVKNDRMFPGDTFEQIVTLSRSDTEPALKAEIRKDGDSELLKWMVIENEDNLIFQEGQTILTMKVTINVPKEAETKNYKGNIYTTLKPPTDSPEGGGGVGIGLGAHVVVDITVANRPALPGTTPVVVPVTEIPADTAQPITVESLVNEPGTTEPTIEESAVDKPGAETPVVSVPEPDVKPATPSSGSNGVKLILGFVALIGVSAGAIIFIRKRRQARTSDTLPTASPPSPAP